MAGRAEAPRPPAALHWPSGNEFFEDSVSHRVGVLRAARIPGRCYPGWQTTTLRVSTAGRARCHDVYGGAAARLSRSVPD